MSLLPLSATTHKILLTTKEKKNNKYCPPQSRKTSIVIGEQPPSPYYATEFFTLPSTFSKKQNGSKRGQDSFTFLSPTFSHTLTLNTRDNVLLLNTTFNANVSMQPPQTTSPNNLPIQTCHDTIRAPQIPQFLSAARPHLPHWRVIIFLCSHHQFTSLFLECPCSARKQLNSISTTQPGSEKWDFLLWPHLADSRVGCSRKSSGLRPFW